MNKLSKKNPCFFPNAQRDNQSDKKNFNSKEIIKSIVWLLLLFASKSVTAQLEVYGKTNSHGSVETVVNYNGSKEINDKLAITFFGLVRKSWSQALIGIAYSPFENVTLYSSLGIEHGQSSPRYSASVFIKKTRNSLLVLGEWGSGESNYLYKINLFHRLSGHLTVGASAWRYHGVGPNFRYLFPVLQSTLWVMPAYDVDSKEKRLMVGINYKM